jgi:hypothetical protein
MRTLLPLALALAPAVVHSEYGPAGVVRSRDAWIELLPPGPTPRELRTPEGFLRLEGPAAPLPSRSGWFGIAPYPARRTTAVPPPEVVGAAPAVAAPVEANADACHVERERFLRRLLEMQGVDLDHPLAFLEGLGGGTAGCGALLFSPYGLLPYLDPIHPLAFDLEARSLARELAACAGRQPAGD